MSHFTVMVIGDDIEGQLQPFHEFECTGVDDQYVQNIDRLPEAKEEYAKQEREETLAQFIEDWYGPPMIGIGQNPVLADKHKYGWCRVDSFGVSEFINRTNPNAKWDYWTVGGRWSGSLLLKKYGPADSALKGEIDFERIRSVKAFEAEERYADFECVTNGLPVHTAWSAMLEKYGTENLETARTEYHAQPVIHALRADKKTTWFDADNFLISRDQYVENARQEAISTHALLHNGVWHERGRMGWFACVSDEKPATDWLTEFNQIVDSLPDDTMITIVDCHI